MRLTPHDRIMRIFQNKEIDRPALKLWGASLDSFLLHPAYRPVCELAAKLSDLFVTFRPPFDIYCGGNAERYVETEIKDTKDETWKDKHVTVHTPKGDLHSVQRISTVGEPSYTVEYMVKEQSDFKKLLSIDYEPSPFQINDYLQKQASLGDRGVVMFRVDHAGYALQRLIGSENLAYFSIDYREELEEIMHIFSNRIQDFIHTSISSGVNGPFQWVGPELFIPPLMSPRDFEDFVYRWDKPLCDDIHNAGSYVWVHSHGKVENFIERYIDMGVDILNPLEPPENGDIHLDSIIKRYGNRIGWEGNIEIQEIIQADPERLKELIRTCVNAGWKSERFILCPSAGFMEYAFPSKQYIDNLLLYLHYGWECVEQCRK
jgi:hypothetical protein